MLGRGRRPSAPVADVQAQGASSLRQIAAGLNQREYSDGTGRSVVGGAGQTGAGAGITRRHASAAICPRLCHERLILEPSSSLALLGDRSWSHYHVHGVVAVSLGSTILALFQGYVMRPINLLVAFLGLALLTQCAEHDPVRRFASSQVSTSTSDAATAAELISQYRAAHGLPPLSVDPRLTAAATAQARTVAEAGTLSHGRFAGRIDALGLAVPRPRT